MTKGEEIRKPDETYVIIKEKGAHCPLCDIAEKVAIRKGESKHVLLIKVELESEFEKRLARIDDGNPNIEVTSSVEGESRDEQ